MENKIKHIFFDLDNTLWDTDKNSKITLQSMFENMQIREKYKINFSDFYKKYYARNEKLWSLYRQEKVTKSDILNHRFTDTFYELGVKDQQICSYFNDHFINKVVENNNLVEYAEDILKYLNQKGYQLHIISNGFIDATENKIQKTPIKNYISTTTSGEEINKRKPAKEVFELGLHKAKAKAEESSFIGDDWEGDIIGGKNMGMFPVFFDYKKEKKYTSREFPVIQELKELKEIF